MAEPIERRFARPAGRRPERRRATRELEQAIRVDPLGRDLETVPILSIIFRQAGTTRFPQGRPKISDNVGAALRGAADDGSTFLENAVAS